MRQAWSACTVYDLWFADTSGFYFNTMISKARYRQVVENPKVELCFHRVEDYLEMLRVRGTVEILDDPGLFPRFMKEGGYLGEQLLTRLRFLS